MCFTECLSLTDLDWPPETCYHHTFGNLSQGRCRLVEVLNIPKKKTAIGLIGGSNTAGSGLGDLNWNKSKWSHLLSFLSHSMKGSHMRPSPGNCGWAHWQQTAASTGRLFVGPWLFALHLVPVHFPASTLGSSLPRLALIIPPHVPLWTWRRRYEFVWRLPPPQANLALTFLSSEVFVSVCKASVCLRMFLFSRHVPLSFVCSHSNLCTYTQTWCVSSEGL